MQTPLHQHRHDNSGFDCNNWLDMFLEGDSMIDDDDLEVLHVKSEHSYSLSNETNSALDLTLAIKIEEDKGTFRNTLPLTSTILYIFIIYIYIYICDEKLNYI